MSVKVSHTFTCWYFVFAYPRIYLHLLEVLVYMINFSVYKECDCKQMLMLLFDWALNFHNSITIFLLHYSALTPHVRTKHIGVIHYNWWCCRSKTFGLQKVYSSVKSHFSVLENVKDLTQLAWYLSVTIKGQ